MAVHLTKDNKDLAAVYDQISNSQYNNGLVLIEMLQVAAGDSVLDVGSGTGRLGRYVSEVITHSGAYLGLDPLEERVKLAKEKNEHRQAEYQIGRAEDLAAVESGSIDIVYLNSVFHWIINKPAALQEIHRVLKPGGKLGITTGARELNSRTGMQLAANNVLSRSPYDRAVNADNSFYNQHGLTTTALLEQLTHEGFQVRDVHVKETQRHFLTAQDATLFFEASSFGNYLNHVPESLRQQAKADVEIELQKLFQNESGEYHLSAYTIFSISQKES